jgi:hypothetical protein
MFKKKNLRNVDIKLVKKDLRNFDIKVSNSEMILINFNTKFKRKYMTCYWCNFNTFASEIQRSWHPYAKLQY